MLDHQDEVCRVVGRFPALRVEVTGRQRRLPPGGYAPLAGRPFGLGGLR